jgi:hypothetical protein
VHRLVSRRLARLRGSPFEGFVRPMFGGGFTCLCWSWTAPWGELVLRRFPSVRVDARGFVADLPASFRGALFEELWRGVRWRRRFWRLWSARRGTKRCRRRSMFFVVGFMVGFVGPLAGVGGGVLFTPLAVVLLGVDVNLARTGGPRGDVFCGWVSPGGGLRILGLCGGGCVAGRVSGGASWLVSGGR